MVEYHVPSNQDRHEEYLACLRENLKNPLIDKVHLFLQTKDSPPIDDPKIVYGTCRNRLYFSDCFLYARENLHGENCIIANSDIMFDDTLGVIHRMDLGNTFICLSRWNVKEDGQLEFYQRSDSQDSWIFTSPMNKRVEEESSFFLGRAGCDNRVAWIAHRAGLKLTNPAHQIISRHLHLVDYRTYDQSSTILKNDGTGRGRWAEFMKVHPTADWELSNIEYR